MLQILYYFYYHRNNNPLSEYRPLRFTKHFIFPLSPSHNNPGREGENMTVQLRRIKQADTLIL